VSVLPPPDPECASCAARDERISEQRELIGELQDGLGVQADQITALGERYFLESINRGNFSYPEIGIVVLEEIFRERSFGPDEWESLLNLADLALDEASRCTPEMALVEDDWFASGMHDSPFAILDDDLPADRQRER
jgi:hypothetical protein